jgi:hypothetical protein
MGRGGWRLLWPPGAAVVFVPLGVFAVWRLAPIAPRVRSDPRHEHEGALHINGGGDQAEMAGVAGEAAIADEAQAVPALDRGVGALNP